MSKQMRAALICGVVLAATPPLACDPVDPSPVRSSVGATVEDGHAAAQRGIDWMLRNAEALPVGWTYAFLSRVSRVVSDPARTRALEQALARDAKSGRHTPIPVDLSDPELLAQARLTPMLFELARRRDLGIESDETLRHLQALIDANEPALIASLAPTQQVVYVHLFDILGLRWSLELETLIARARAVAEREPVAKLATSAQYGYTLTHLVLARSEYLRRAVDPVELGFVLPILDEALRLLLTASNEERADVFSYDLQAEILMCRQLLGAAENDDARRTRAVLIATQAADGSWGPPGPPSRRNTHVTASAILGLADYPARLRPGRAH